MFLVSLLAQLLSQSALGQAAERQTVQAVLSGDPAVVERLVSVLRPSLDHQGLSLSSSRAIAIDPLDAVRLPREPSAGLPVAYLWLDLSAKPVTLILVETKSRLVYAQPLRVHADPDDVETELIRFVIEQSLAAILSGGAPGVTAKEYQRSLPPRAAKPAAPAPPPPPSTQPQDHPASSALRWVFSAGYSLSALGAQAIAHGPELGAEVRTPRVHVQLRLAQRLPLSLTRDQASLRLISSAARLLASTPITVGGGWALSPGLGAGLDVTRVTGAAEGAVPAFWVSDPLLVSQIGLEHAWGAWLLAGYGGIEFDLLASRYSITRLDGEHTVWAPSRVRPCAGVSFGHLF